MTEKVLILHGWEDSSRKGFIPELVKTLKEKGYDPLAIDLPNTEAPKFEQWFDFAEEQIKEEEDLSIVGHSMGGLLALKLAEKHKVNKLVLVAPVGSKPSDEYYTEAIKDINEEEGKIFKAYNDRDINIDKIKSNSKEIDFIFGKKDPWILEEIRNFYTEKFKDVANIQVLDNYAHMAESEGVKKLPEAEKLFDKTENKTPEKKAEENKEEPKKEETKPEEKKAEEKRKEKPKIPKKDEAVARGSNLRMSKRHGMYICDFIRHGKIDKAIDSLEQVRLMKVAIPFKGEIPHRKGKGMMSGRYPVKGAGLIISVLKGLKGNVIVNGMDLEKVKIHFASASWGDRPTRSGRRRGKRTNVILKAKEVGGKK